MKYKEIVYMALDELKLFSDDADFTEEHIIFLANKYRALLLKQRYADIKKEIPQSNYQTICLDLEKTEAVDGLPCEGGYYLRTTKEVPTPMTIGTTRLFAQSDYYKGEITYITKDRMRYVGYNHWMNNIIYASQNPNGHIYFNSNNPQFLYLQNARMTAVFEDIEKASELECDTSECDIMDKDFPLEGALVPLVIQMIVKELTGAEYKPDDSNNNSSDDLSNLATFLARNVKSRLAKQIEDQ